MSVLVDLHQSYGQTNPSYLDLQGPKEIDGKSKRSGPSSRPMSKSGIARKTSPIAERARVLREAMDYDTSNAFAAFLGVSPQRWNNIETGLPLSNQMAFLLVQKVPGLTLDWLYFGKADGLPLELARRLGELGPGQSSKTRP